MIISINIFTSIYVIGFITSIIYLYIIKKYNIRKKNLEHITLSILLISMISPFIITLYSALTRDIHFNYIFMYTSGSMNSLESLLSTLYSLPSTYILLSLIPMLLLYRFKYWYKIYRKGFRNIFSSYILSITAIFAFTSIFNPLKLNFNVIVPGGQGPYPYQADPFIVISIFLAYILIGLSTFIFTYYIVGWLNRDEDLEYLAKKSLIIATGIAGALLFLRLYYLNIHYIKDGFIRWNIFDLNIFLLFTILLQTIDLVRIMGARHVGSVAFTGYLGLISSLSPLVTITPLNIGSLYSEIDAYSFSTYIIIISIVSWYIIGGEIFRRSFYPWDSEETEYLTRFSSSLIYYLVIFMAIFIFFNLSVYYTAGRTHVLISEDYIMSMLILLALAPFTSILSSIAVKFSTNINYILVIIFIVLVFILGGYNYNILLIKNNLIYILLSSFIFAVISMLYKKGFNENIPLGRIILISIVIILLIGLSSYSKRSVINVSKGSTYTLTQGYKLKIENIYATNSSISVYKNINDTKPIPLYTVEATSFSNGMEIYRYKYNAKDFEYNDNALVQEGNKLYFICLDKISQKNTMTYIYDVSIEWSIYLYIILVILALILPIPYYWFRIY